MCTCMFKILLAFGMLLEQHTDVSIVHGSSLGELGDWNVESKEFNHDDDDDDNDDFIYSPPGRRMREGLKKGTHKSVKIYAVNRMKWN